jgi:hypothetical protein
LAAMAAMAATAVMARPPRAAMAAAWPKEAKLLAVIFLKKFYHNKFEKKKL